MRKWLFLLLAIALIFVLPKIDTRRTRRVFPLMKRIDMAVNVAVVLLLAIYLYAFIHWLLTR